MGTHCLPYWTHCQPYWLTTETMATTMDKATLHQWLDEWMQTDQYEKKQAEITRKVISHLTQSLHELKTRCIKLENDNENLKKIIRQHDEEIQELKQRSNIHEKENKRNNLQIIGLKEEKDEDTKEKVRSFLEENMKLKIRSENIVAAERVGLIRNEQNTRSRKIIIKFNNVWVKRDIYRQRTVLKDLKEKSLHQ